MNHKLFYYHFTPIFFMIFCWNVNDPHESIQCCVRKCEIRECAFHRQIQNFSPNSFYVPSIKTGLSFRWEYFNAINPMKITYLSSNSCLCILADILQILMEISSFLNLRAHKQFIVLNTAISKHEATVSM